MRWLCPKCQRDISLAYEVCPFCGASPEEVVAEAPKRAEPSPSAATAWADVKRGFRFGMGFLLAVGIVLFALAALYLLLGRSEWMDRLLSWLGQVLR